MRSQAAECSQLCRLLSSDDPNHQRGVAMSITVTMSAVQYHTPNVTQTRCRTVAVHRRWGGSLWATIIVAVESLTDLFVASYWLERSSSRFSVTLLVFSRADHSTLQVLTTFYVVFISTFYWRLASKALQLIRFHLIGPLPWRHTPRFCSDARSIQLSQNIHACRKASMQAGCSATRPS